MTSTSEEKIEERIYSKNLTEGDKYVIPNITNERDYRKKYLSIFVYFKVFIYVLLCPLNSHCYLPLFVWVSHTIVEEWKTFSKEGNVKASSYQGGLVMWKTGLQSSFLGREWELRKVAQMFCSTVCLFNVNFTCNHLLHTL